MGVVRYPIGRGQRSLKDREWQWVCDAEGRETPSLSCCLGLGSAVSSVGDVRGRSPAACRFSCIMVTPYCLSRQFTNCFADLSSISELTNGGLLTLLTSSSIRHWLWVLYRTSYLWGPYELATNSQWTRICCASYVVDGVLRRTTLVTIHVTLVTALNLTLYKRLKQLLSF